MTKTRFERYFAVLLFVAVVIAFSFAEKESKKIQPLYTTTPQGNSPMAIKPIAP
jgi:hypothetical protein